MSLSQIRRVIGKNTKFKQDESWTSDHRNILSCFQSLFLSFTIFALVVLPVVGTAEIDADAISLANQGKNRDSLYKSWSRANFRFAGGEQGEDVHEVTFSPSFSERLNRNTFGGDGTRRVKDFIKKRVLKYKRSVEDVYSHLEDDREDKNLTLSEENTMAFRRNTSTDYSVLRRSKRDTIYQDGLPNLARMRRKTVNHESEGTFVINQVDRASPQYYDGIAAIDINCQQVNNKTVVFSIEETENGTEVMMHQLNDKNLRQSLLIHGPAPNAVSVDVLKLKGRTFLFTTVNHQPQIVGSTETINTGSTLYLINPSNKTFDKIQTIHLPFAKSSAYWTGMGTEANDMFLALAPEKVVVSSSKISYNVQVPLYRWQGGYFDYVSQLPASNPQSIQHFAMFSHDYLAVANYQDDTGSTSVHSEIFKYNHKDSKFVSWQRIQTYGAKDIRHFTFSNEDERRQEHFIAIANSCKRDESGKPQFWVQSTIMKFGRTRFLPFKSFYSYGALQFLPVKDKKKFFLAFADLHGIRIFQYNGWTFVETFSKRFSEKGTQGHGLTSSPFSMRLREFNGLDEGQTYFTIATQNQNVENGMFGVSFETRNDHRKLITSVEAWCSGANNQMKQQDLIALEQQLNAAPKVNDSSILVKGDIRFDNGVIVQELKSQALRLGRGRSLDHNKLKQMAGIERDFKGLEKIMSVLQDKLLNSVVWRTSSEQQTINSKVHFSHGFVYENDVLRIRHLTVKNTMGSIQVSDHLDNLIFLNQPSKLRSIVTDDVIVNDVSLTTLNGIVLADYALSHPSTSSKNQQVFTGNNEFRSFPVQVTKEIQVGHQFAGLSFTQPKILLLNGNQTFAGITMDLTDSTVKNLYTRLFNGMDIPTIFQDAVLLSGGVIKADKRFVSSDGVTMKAARVTSINNEDMKSLYENAIYATGKTEQVFSEPVYFENLEIDHITPQNPNINEQYDVNFNLVKKNGQKYSLKNMKVNSATNIDNLFVMNQLNEIQVLQDSSNRLDVLFRNSNEPQHTKSKTLQSVQFTKDVEATELVDGVHLQGWSHELKIQLDKNEIRGVLTLPNGHLKMEDGVLVGNSLLQNDIDVLNALQNSARLTADTIPGNCHLRFDSLTVMGNSDVIGTINGVKPGQWVVNSEKSTVLEITGEKNFMGPVHLDKDVGANALYGRVEEEGKKENLVDVYPTLLLDGVDQMVTNQNQMVFIKKFRAGQASCPNAILDKVPFKNLLFKTGVKTVDVETKFRSPFVAKGDVQVENDVTTVLFNGIDIDSQLRNTLRTNGEEIGVQNLVGHWQFEELEVTDDTNVKGLLSSSDVESLYGNIIRKDSKEIVLTGTDLKFGQKAILSRVDFLGRVNSIPSMEWGNAWLLSRTDQVVKTKVEFEGPVEATMFEAQAVNSVDIEHLSENILRIDRDETVDSDGMQFQSLVAPTAGISMPNGININGINLAKDVLLKNNNELQTISGAKVFKNGATIEGDMVVNEIPGFDIANFAKLLNEGVSIEENERSPTSLHVKGNLQLVDEPEVVSSFNGKNWDEMLSTFWMKDKDVVLSSPVKFSFLKTRNGGKLKNSATLNGIDLDDFQKNYASRTRPQTWTGDVTLAQVNEGRTLKASSLSLENDGKFNDVDLAEFYNSVLRYSEDQEIVWKNLEVENLIVDRLHGDDAGNVQINNVDVENFMTVSGPNIVTFKKTLQKLRTKLLVLSDDTVLDGVNLGEWNEGAVSRTGSHEIRGPVEFESLEATNNMIVDGFVDSMKFDVENVITTDTDQVIPNRIIITQPKGSRSSAFAKSAPVIKARGGVNFKGKVNEINVEDSISKMVFKNEDSVETTDTKMEPIVIKSGTVFNAPLILNQVKTEALIQGQNVTAMMDSMARAHDEVHSKGFKANERYSSLLAVTKRMVSVSEKRAVFLDHFVPTQTIKGASTYVKVLRQVGYPAVAIGFIKPDGTTTEKWLSYNTALDYYQLQIGSRVQLEGTVTDVAELSSPGGISGNNINSNTMFAFAVNNESNERPAHTTLEMIKTNNVQSFEVNKSPDKLSKTFILQSVDVGTPNIRPAVSQVIYSNKFKSLRSFDVITSVNEKFDGGMSSTRCMIATSSVIDETESSAQIFCLDEASGMLQLVQEMALDSPSLTTSTRVPATDATILGILTRTGHGQPEGLLEIWIHQDSSDLGNSKLQGGRNILFSKQSCLPVFNLISLDSLSTQEGKTFLVLASGPWSDSVYEGSIFIYRYNLDTQQFQKVQTIQVNHPLDVKLQWLQPSNEIVMYVLSEAVTNNVQVYKCQGLSGWSVVHQFTSKDGRSLEVTDFTFDSIYRAQLLVTSPMQTNIYAAEFMGVNTVIEEELMESSHHTSVSSSSTLLRGEFIEFNDNL